MMQIEDSRAPKFPNCNLIKLTCIKIKMILRLKKEKMEVYDKSREKPHCTLRKKSKTA